MSGHQAPLPDLGPVDGEAPSVALEWRRAAALTARAELTPTGLSTAERGGPTLEIRRRPLAVTIEHPDRIEPEALVHPLLTTPLAILARWRGDITLHAGCFYIAGSAWGVVGSREAGKSTTLTMLAQRGVALLADDLLVIDGGVVRAGPACVDLRPDVARRIPAARSMGQVAGRERFRLGTPAGPARAPLAGVFLVEWGDAEEVEVERLATRDALSVIYEHEYMGLLGPAEPDKIIELLGTPMWRVRRPRLWDSSAGYVDRLLAIADGDDPSAAR